MIREIFLYVKPVLFVTVLFILISCSGKKKEGGITPLSFIVDTTQIPKDTILATAKNLKLNNGFYFFYEKRFSGYIIDYYEINKVKIIAGYLNEMQKIISTTLLRNWNI